MRKFFLAAFLSPALFAQANDYWCLNNTFSVFGEYAYLRRSEIRDKSLVKDSTKFQTLDETLDEETVINTKQLLGRFDWESSFRVGATLSPTQAGYLEVLYQYVYPYCSSKTVTSDGFLRFPFKETSFTNDFFEADKVLATYESQFQNAEGNFWACVTPRRVNYFSFYWLVGVRYIYLKEEFGLAFTKEGRTSSYDISTKNTLYGAQLGANLDINPSRCWTLSVRLKGAGFYNDGRNKVFLGDLNNTVALRNYRRDKETGSYLLEGWGQISYHSNPYLDIHVAYQGLLLSGLLLAPEQVTTSVNLNHHHASDGGQIVLDGIYAGITLSF